MILWCEREIISCKVYHASVFKIKARFRTSSKVLHSNSLARETKLFELWFILNVKMAFMNVTDLQTALNPF